MTADDLAGTDDQMCEVRSLRICFISRALPAHRLGGLEYHLRDLARALSRRGHVIHILTTKGGSADAVANDNERITVHEIAGTKPGDYSAAFFLRVKKAALDICVTHPIDILCPIDLAGLFLSPADFSAVVVPLIHGTLTSEVPLDWRYWPHLGGWDKLKAVWRFKSRIGLVGSLFLMIQRVEAVLVDSEFTRRELMFAGISGARGKLKQCWEEGERAAAVRRKVYVAQLGIDPERYPEPRGEMRQCRSVEAPLRICVLGRLQKVKGVEQAIYAARALKARGSNFLLTIGGNGEFAEEAKSLVFKLGLEDRVRFTGRVDPADLASFFGRQDVFLFPDLTQPAFGLVAVEAMHYGLPVVAANVGAVSEVVGDCGWIYDAWDINELAGLLAYLADNPAELARKASAVKEYCAYFTAEQMAKRTEKIFLEILDKKLINQEKNGGADEARTRDLRRDRPAF